ncbi:MAG: permease [Victivallales bacterium]|nr:permease [Victivallales bacterium]
MGSIIKAALIGIPMPLCPKAIIPSALSLRRRGAGKGAATAFLISTPQTGMDSLIVTGSMLGGIFVLFKIAAAFIGGLLGGIAVENSSEPDPPRPEREPYGVPKEPEKAILQIIKYGFGIMFRDAARPLLTGLLTAAVIATFVPSGFFEQFEYNSWGPILLMLAIGTTIHVYSVASIPIAAALMLKGLSPGVALIFLIAGPATNLAAIATMHHIIGKRGVVIYLLSNLITAAGAGILLDWYIGLIPETTGCRFIGDHIPTFSQICGSILLLLIFRVLFFRDNDNDYNSAVTGDDPLHPANTLIVKVPQLTDTVTAAAIRRAILFLHDVDRVETDPAAGTVTIIFNYDHTDSAAVRAVLVAAGFTMRESV